ncbi:MAG: hypothetical protein MK102_03705 [Fuerstiella sp.]|nr:hypothetical protein [Fuerstiella sp.]
MLNADERLNQPVLSTGKLLLMAAVLLPGLCGCGLIITAGKMVMGESKSPSSFEQITGTNLVESKDRLLIICTAPHRVLVEFPSVQLELLDRISQNLERREIQVVSPDDVAAWYDDHGEWGDYSELAEHFGARYVVHLSLRTFSFLEPESTNLLRGRSEGTVKVYEIDSKGSIPVFKTFERDLRVKFPEIHPVPRESGSDDVFVNKLINRLALQTSQLFHDHGLNETIF